MANTVRGDVALEVGGRGYTLRLSINAICELEAEHIRRGLPFEYLGFFSSVQKGSIGSARLLLWACLRDHHPIVSVDEAGRMIEALPDIATIWAALSEAMAASAPESGDVAELRKGNDGADRPTTARPVSIGTGSAGRRVKRA